MSPINRFVAATALATTAVSGFAVPAEARTHRTHYYSGRSAQVYRACRPSSGTAGLIAGGVGGALVGKSIVGHGLLGTAVGALGGAFAGRAIDRTLTARQRCAYYR